MKSNRLPLLATVTGILVIIAILLARQDAPQTSQTREYLFPELDNKINELNEITIQSKGKSLSLFKQEADWFVKEADNYPAKFDKIRQTAVAAADLRIIAEKTNKPTLYEKLGVEEPLDKGASSTLLTFKDAKQNQLLSLIVGNTRQSKAAGGKPGLYVRLSDSERALLVEGKLDISMDLNDWFERNLLDIKSERIRSVHIQHRDQSSLLIQRKNSEGELTLEDTPNDRTIDNVELGRVPSLLENIYIDNVKADNNQLTPQISIITTVKTFDGLVATVNSAELDDANYIKLTFSYEAPLVEKSEPEAKQDIETTEDSTSPVETSADMADIKQEVEKLNNIVSGWIYEIPNYKFELFRKQTEDLLEEIEEGSSESTS